MVGRALTRCAFCGVRRSAFNLRVDGHGQRGRISRCRTDANRSVAEASHNFTSHTSFCHGDAGASLQLPTLLTPSLVVKSAETGTMVMNV